MSYKNDSIQTIMARYGKASDAINVETYETWDAIRHMAVGGNALGGSGMGAFSSFLMNIARMFGSPAFSPILGSQAISIPGTNYYTPISGGTGIVPGGQASFGLAPWSQFTGLPTGGAASTDVWDAIQAFGVGSTSSGGYGGIGDIDFGDFGFIGGAAAPIDFAGSATSVSSPNSYNLGRAAGGTVVGGADSFGGIGTAGSVVASEAGIAAGLGLGRNWLMPAASALSGIGGLLTTLGPLFGPIGLAGVAAGGVINGVAGAILDGFQQTNQRVLANADTVMEEKLSHLGVTKKMLGAQTEVLKKMLKEAYENDKKALDEL